MKKILVVDDEEQNRSYLETLFKAQGFHVTIARNGAQALEAARKNPPHIIISDILMPVMDGFMLCKEWKNDSRLKKIPFVFYTATYTEPKDEKLALDLGADLFVIKPQEPDILLDLIQKVMAKRKSEKKEKTQESETSAEVVLKEYNETLFRKLEKKLQQLKTANQGLRILEERYRLSFDHVSDVIYTIDTNLNILSVSPSVEKVLGYKPQDFIGRPVLDQRNILTPSSFEQAIADINLILKGETISARIYEFVAADGTIKIVEVSGSPIIRDGQVAGLISVARDITKRQLAEEALRESEQSLASIYNTVGDVIFHLAVEPAGQFRFVSVNSAFLKVTGLTQEMVVGRTVNEIIPEPSLTMVLGKYQQAIAENTIVHWEEISDYPTGRLTGLVSIAPVFDDKGTCTHMVGSVQNITESRQMEDALRKSEEKYRTLVENAQEGIYQSTVGYITLNPALAHILGYDSPEEVMATITDIAQQLYVKPDDRRKLLEMVNEKGSITDFEAEYYKKDGSRIWVSINMHAVRDDQGRLLYYQGINQDITEKKKIEAERKENIERLRKSLGATINAMAVTVETRDPYTAGHQRRVADLARAIAVEMNLTSDQIDSVRMASVIHDIGKISIPSEILSKPAKLTDLEFSLIKTHPASGYNILKDIEFPWPIARIILEHHERMDGSGYPNGLIGDSILLESRILAVADVVEAMASHRPYRPALGIDASLEEIKKNRRVLYDREVVDACLTLFIKKQYKILD